MRKPVHKCPLCSGTGKVSASVAEAKITVRDREKYNTAMRQINKNARLRRKAKDLVAT